MNAQFYRESDCEAVHISTSVLFVSPDDSLWDTWRQLRSEEIAYAFQIFVTESLPHESTPLAGARDLSIPQYQALLRNYRMQLGNGTWAIKWSRDRWRHVTPKGAVRQLRSAISATAWLLVTQAMLQFHVTRAPSAVHTLMTNADYSLINCTNCCRVLNSPELATTSLPGVLGRWPWMT